MERHFTVEKLSADFPTLQHIFSHVNILKRNVIMVHGDSLFPFNDTGMLCPSSCTDRTMSPRCVVFTVVYTLRQHTDGKPDFHYSSCSTVVSHIHLTNIVQFVIVVLFFFSFLFFWQSFGKAQV